MTSEAYAAHAGTCRFAYISAIAMRRSFGASAATTKSTTAGGGDRPRTSVQPAYIARTASAHAAFAAGPVASGTHRTTLSGVRTSGAETSEDVVNRPRPRSPSPGADAGYSIASARLAADGSVVDDDDDDDDDDARGGGVVVVVRRGRAVVVVALDDDDDDARLRATGHARIT